MKTILAKLLFLASAVLILTTSVSQAAFSNTVTFTWQDFQGIPLVNYAMKVTPKAVGTNAAAITSIDPKKAFITDATGTIILSNMVFGGYSGFLTGPQVVTPIQFVVPLTNGDYDVKDLMTNTSPALSGQFVQYPPGGTANGWLPISTNAGAAYFWGPVPTGGGGSFTGNGNQFGLDGAGANVIKSGATVTNLSGNFIGAATSATNLTGNLATTQLTGQVPIGNISQNAILSASGNGTNTTLTNGTVINAQEWSIAYQPSNSVYTETATVSATAGTEIYTITSGTIPGIKKGWSIITSGNDQHLVIKTNGSTITVFPAIAGSVTNVHPVMNPNAATYYDTTGAFVGGAVDAGGNSWSSLYGSISGLFLSNEHNETNGWMIGDATFDGQIALAFYSFFNPLATGAAFQMVSGAPYNSLVVGQGYVAIRGPIINENFGNLQLGGGVSQTTNVEVVSSLLVDGNITGNGNGITTLNGSSISSGTVADARLSANVDLLNAVQAISGGKTFSATNFFSAGSNTFSGTVYFSNTTNSGTLNVFGAANFANGAALFDGSGNETALSLTLNGNAIISGSLQSDTSIIHSDGSGHLTANSFIGTGSSLTALNASSISSGTVADARLSANVPLLNVSNIFTAGISNSGGLSVAGGTYFPGTNTAVGFNFTGNTTFKANGGSTLNYVPTATDGNGNWSWQAAGGGGSSQVFDPNFVKTNGSVLVAQNPIALTNFSAPGTNLFGGNSNTFGGTNWMQQILYVQTNANWGTNSFVVTNGLSSISSGTNGRLVFLTSAPGGTTSNKMIFDSSLGLIAPAISMGGAITLNGNNINCNSGNIQSLNGINVISINDFGTVEGSITTSQTGTNFTVTSLRVGATGFSIKGIALQTQNYFEVNDSTNNHLFSVTPIGVCVLSNGFYSGATNWTASVTSTGYTNSGPRAVTVLEFTGTSTRLSNSISTANIALGTITTGMNYDLNPNDCLVGTACAASGIREK